MVTLYGDLVNPAITSLKHISSGTPKNTLVVPDKYSTTVLLLCSKSAPFSKVKLEMYSICTFLTIKLYMDVENVYV